MPRSASKLVTLCLSAALCAPVLAACGDDGEGGSKAKKLSVTATGSGKSARLEAPKSVDGGVVEIDFKNDSKSQRGAQLVRVDGKHSRAEVLKVVGSEGAPIPGWLHGAGGTGDLKPGQSATATQELSEGNYYIVADTDQGKAAATPLTVKGGDGGELPKTGGKITAKEYSFTSSGLEAGDNEVEFDNAGPKQLHHVVALPMKQGATLAEVAKFAQSEGKSKAPPPVDFEAGVNTAVLDPGAREVTRLKLKKGRYALLCFISDREGGPPHVAKGMLSEATVR